MLFLVGVSVSRLESFELQSLLPVSVCQMAQQESQLYDRVNFKSPAYLGIVMTTSSPNVISRIPAYQPMSSHF